MEKVILFENGMDYVSLEVMLPSSHKELQENGYATMADIDYKYVLSQKDTTQQERASYSYEISEAVAYMTRYTSNPTNCNACSGGCDKNVDTTKYNPQYSHYAANHRDCANYVSQALCEGGIPTDSTWKASSNAWVNVDSLTNYMSNNGYWTRVSYSILQKGDIISFSSYSHVVMITSFNGTTYSFSGHTNDRKNCAIALDSSSTNKFYRAG